MYVFLIFAQLFIFSIFSFANSELLKLSFEQPLDHFNESGIADRFNQTYYIWDDYWEKPTGPLFIFMGYASPLLPEQFTKAGTITEATKRFKGLVLAIEQRYYGESLTYDMLRREKLTYLTSQQMLADIASIQQKVMNDYNISASSAKIIFGYSFGGFHAVYYRM